MVIRLSFPIDPSGTISEITRRNIINVNLFNTFHGIVPLCVNAL